MGEGVRDSGRRTTPASGSRTATTCAGIRGREERFGRPDPVRMRRGPQVAGPRLPFLPHPVFLSIMAESPRRPAPEAQAEERIREILRAADSWAREAPKALMPAIRAVCIRLAEMVADQRHYLAPLPEPQETERRTVLTMVADRLRSQEVTAGVEEHLKGLEELELRSTGSWATVASAQSEWITTAIRYLESCAAKLPAGRAPRLLLGRRRRRGHHRLGPRPHRRGRAARPHRGAILRPHEAGGPGRGALDRLHGLGLGAAFLRLARGGSLLHFLRRSATPLREQLEEPCRRPGSRSTAGRDRASRWVNAARRRAVRCR